MKVKVAGVYDTTAEEEVMIILDGGSWRPMRVKERPVLVY